MSESVSRWANESVNQGLSGSNESMNQWINESVSHCFHESMDQWPWMNELVSLLSQWIRQSMNESVSESMTQCVNKRKWMDAWMDGWVSYFFVELPLHWSTFFSEQPLFWATSALTCLPASSSVASAAQSFSSRSCYNSFSNLQLQSRLPGASQHH